MSSFVIKMIAVICMLCDHASDALIGHFTFLNVIGRIAFPLFCFQLVNGYRHTKNVKKYIVRLLIFAFISQIPFSIFTYIYAGIYDNLNVFFTLAFGLIAMYALDKVPNKWLSLLINLICIAVAELVHVDYGGLGVCIILCIFIFYKDRSINLDKKDFLYPFKNNIVFALVFLFLCIARYFNSFKTNGLLINTSLILATYFPIIFMLLYNGKKGPSMKYFFYIFYPAHLVILCVLHFII